MTLTDFLLARLAEDEAAALGAGDFKAYRTDGLRKYLQRNSDGATIDLTNVHKQHEISWWSHAIQHLPARVLAECAAKRAIVDVLGVFEAALGDQSSERMIGTLNGLRIAVKELGVIYAGHPDYDEAWRP